MGYMKRGNTVPGIHSQAGRINRKDYAKPRPIYFNQKPFENSEITLQVCQGLGDIFWVYQKFSPYFDRINFAVSVLNESPVQLRSLEWLKCFPKVNEVTVAKITGDQYGELVGQYSSMRNSVDKWQNDKPVLYSCNRWLETGTRLDDIDTGAIVEWNVPLKTEDAALPFQEYATLFVSGTTSNEEAKNDPKLQIWDVDRWIVYVSGLWQKYSLNWPIVVLGADFDKEVSEQVMAKLGKQGFKTHLMMQQSPAKVLDCIAKSKLHVGYQSGLSIVADNFAVKQMMIYFPYLSSMLYTWCNRDHIRKQFNADTFNTDPVALLKKHNLF